MLLRPSCRIGLPARQRAGSGDLRDRATGDVLDPAPRRAAADAASPARRRPRWRAAHSANLFAPVPHGHRVPVAREGEERTGRQGRARPSPSRPATPAIRRLRLADGSPLNAASYAPPVNPVLRAWSSRSWSGRARRNCWSEGSAPRVAGRPGRRPSRAPAPPRYKARSTVRTMVAEAGFVRGGQCGTRGGPPLRHGGPRRESFGLRGRVVPHGCSRDPPACEEPSNAKRLVPIRRDGGTGRRDGLNRPGFVGGSMT